MISTLRRAGTRAGRAVGASLAGRPAAAAAPSVTATWRDASPRSTASPVIGGPIAPARAMHTEQEASIFYPAPSANIMEPAPGFKAKAVVDGDIVDVSTDDYKGKWVVLLFYPKDWTFVCPTEIIAFSDRHSEFEALGAQVLGISTDTEDSHLAWTRHPRKRGGLGHMRIPLVADPTKEISADYGVLIPSLGIALRGLFIINPEGILEQVTINNLGIGRDVDETLRLIQAHQFLAKHGEVCPAGWKPGDKTMKPGLDASMEYFSSGATESEEDPLEAGDKMVVINSPNDFKDVTSEALAVVDFVAPHCGKCRQMMPFVKELSEEFPEVTFAKFDTTEEAISELSTDLGVEALPAFRFYRKGEEVVEPVMGYKKKKLRAAVEELQKKA
ncbi:2-cys peroxiredoxin [Ectocarpus siliculosus]|uniref:thioredoxin-dependent peroxiredoxin n=1 Tax=Ectocarpus siliculosus TaxID=2880 RepID=D7G6K3_ECTSI|nr:2-cys peroxiredoxin [Ectocarpus siliculosus]|eukprot:CBJ27588.1 2-cys peroxiredoxin [Ectocarpus siliculosus]